MQQGLCLTPVHTKLDMPTHVSDDFSPSETHHDQTLPFDMVPVFLSGCPSPIVAPDLATSVQFAVAHIDTFVRFLLTVGRLQDSQKSRRTGTFWIEDRTHWRS